MFLALQLLTRQIHQGSDRVHWRMAVQLRNLPRSYAWASKRLNLTPGNHSSIVQ